MIIYKTINLLNGKIYVGQHNTSADDGYLGSGLILNRAIKKYGKNYFHREILDFCNSQEELNKKEIEWIGQLSATDFSVGYNVTNGGGYGVVGLSADKNHFFGKKHSEESKKKMSEFHKGEKAYWFGKKQPKHMIETRKKAVKESNSRKVKIKGNTYDSMVHAESVFLININMYRM